MKTRLLLDSHVPADVADAVRDLCPDVDVQHVSTWQEGAYINAADDVLLEACWQDGPGAGLEGPRHAAGMDCVAAWPTAGNTAGWCSTIWSGSKPTRLAHWPGPSPPP